MSNFLNKIPVSPITSFGNPSVPNGSTFGTNFSILQTGGFMEVYTLSGLTYTIPPATTGIIEFSGNSIPIQFTKGAGSTFSPDVLTLNSDNISSGRRKLGMLVYVYETNKIYQFKIDNYDTLWNNATGATGPGGATVVISDFGTTVKNNSAAGIAFISAWTSSTISGIGGYNDTNASWRVLSTGGSGGGTTFTGGTVTGATNFTNGLTANTFSAGTYYNLPVSGVTGGTGISANTTNGIVTIVNTTPDQIVTLSGGTGISTGGTYPNFVLTNTAPDQTVTITGGTNINVNGTYPNFGINFTGSTGVSGDFLPLSGGTVSGATNFTSGLTANTISTNSLRFESSDDEIILSKQVTNWWLDGNTLNVGGNEASPSGIFFNPDGDKLFIIGTTGDDITPYNLSTPWDLTTATVTTPTYFISGETNPNDLYFKPDGTKMYVIGSSSDLVREFTLSNPWDFNSVIVGPTLSVSVQDTSPTGLFFKPDGSKMYVVGDTNDKVYEYDISVAWDLTSAGFNGNEFSLSSRETSVSSISFNNDGTIMYVLGGTGDDITQYNLSNAWNISSAQYCCQSFTFLQENFPNGLYYNEDVEKAFVVGSSADNVIGLNTDKQLFFDYGSATVNGQLFVNGRLESTNGFYVNGNSGVLGNLNVSSLFTSLNIRETSSTITLGTSNTTSIIIDGPTAEDSRITIGNQRITSGYTRTINIGNNGYLGSKTDIVLGSATPLGTINNTLPTIFGQTVNINGQLIVDNKKTPLVSSNTATGVTVVYDTFTETSNTLLNLHTPDTGSTWSRVQISTFTTATFTVFGSTDTMGPTANLSDQGVIYRQDTVLTESDYEVSVNLSTQDSSDDVMWLFARFIDVNNFYGVRWSTTSTNCGLYKRVNGTYTLLSLLVINPITGSTSLTLRVYSGYIIVLNGGNIVITAYDKDITSPGYAAIGAGNIGLTSTDDIDSTWKFDNFKVQYYTQNYDDTIITNGNLLIGTQTNIPSSKLTVESTTQGFLPPRMTGIQMSGITTPSIGLMVYQTDSTEGLYVYSSTGWRRLNWS